MKIKNNFHLLSCSGGARGGVGGLYVRILSRRCSILQIEAMKLQGNYGFNI